MQIKELYIENFGKLSSFRLNLKDGLNVICEENGFGKTTIGAFIKAMLFGFEETKKQSLLENERKRYLPWQGGAFGGWLTFVVGGEDFRIERSFGQKASEDKFTVYKVRDGLKTDEFGDNPGEKIFGIDSDGFERTVFLSEKNLDGKNENQTISAKLSDLVGVEGDIGGFDAAIELLEKRRKFYRLKGGRGQIKDLEVEESEICDRLKLIEAKRREGVETKSYLAALEEKINALTEKKNALLTLKKKAMEEKNSYANRLQFAKMKASASELEGREDRLIAFFEKKLPDYSEIEKVAEARAEARRLREQLRTDGAITEEIPSPFAKIPESDDIDRYSENPYKINSASGAAIAILFGALAVIGGAVLGFFIAPYMFFISLLGAAVIALGATFKISNGKKRGAFEKFEDERLEFARKTLGVYTDGGADEAIKKIKRLYNEYRERLKGAEAVKAAFSKQTSEMVGKCAELEELVEEFTSLFPQTEGDTIDTVRKMLAEYEFVGKELKVRRRELEEFAATHKISEETHGELPDVYELEGKIAEVDSQFLDLCRDKALLESRCAAAAADVDRAAEYEAKLQEIREKIKEARLNFEVITKTEELLEKAKSNMTAKYLDGTKRGFEKYISLIHGAYDGTFSIDTSFSVLKNDMGTSRPTDAYSKGSRLLYSLAVRLALTDSLYDGELPPLIMDDPFAYFDDPHTKKALVVLKELSRTRQIIYFTCSKSRA